MKFTALFGILAGPFALVGVVAGFIYGAFIGGFEGGRTLVERLADEVKREARK